MAKLFTSQYKILIHDNPMLLAVEMNALAADGWTCDGFFPPNENEVNWIVLMTLVELPGQEEAK